MGYRRSNGSLQDERLVRTAAARFRVGELESERGDSKPGHCSDKGLDRRVTHARAGPVGEDEKAAWRFGLKQQAADPPVLTDGDAGFAGPRHNPNISAAR